MTFVDLPSDRPVWTCERLVAAAVAGPPGTRICATGAGPGATALVVRELAARTRRLVLAVADDLTAAGQLAADVAFALGLSAEGDLELGRARDLLWLWDDETSPWAGVAPDRAAGQARLAALLRLARAETRPRVLVASAGALVRKVMPAAAVLEHSARVVAGEDVDRECLLGKLGYAGYARCPVVEEPGSLAVRGGLLDVWPPTTSEPVRVELCGDRVASLRFFDPATQRSGPPLGELWLPPVREPIRSPEALARARRALGELCDAVDWPSTRTRRLIEELAEGRSGVGSAGLLPAFGELGPLGEQLPSDVIVVLENPGAVAGAIAALMGEAREAATGAAAVAPCFGLESFYVDGERLGIWLSGVTTVALAGAPVAGEDPDAALCPEAAAVARLEGVDPTTPSLATADQAELTRAVRSARAAMGHAGFLDPLVKRIAAWREAGMKVVLVARTRTLAERLALMLENRNLDAAVALEASDPDELYAHPGRARCGAALRVVVGTLARGIVAPAEGLAFVTEEEIFGSRAPRPQPSASAGARARALLADLRTLAVGDHVVHAEHGIGRYLGLTRREIGGAVVELVALQYAGGDRLYVPVHRLSQIQKYRGPGATPALDRLGGRGFVRTKARAARRVRQLADELLRLYAERQAAAGEPTAPADDDYRAFEAGFPFDETDDQTRAIAEVGADLEAARPMDRLVCGDAGFGKTEVALRAALRVAMSGRQVALLCPTTVLAQQHRLTFAQRLEGYPLRVAALSRFQPRSEQRAVARGLREGTIDIVIGTHRLLSHDVHFRRLGLLVVDEEQRFGVAAKERIKALKKNVDVLTLTATPIPRTLQMAVSGLRDLSVIATPPAGRRAGRTIVARPDPAVLREAIGRELGRGGQVFYVHNRIEGLAERAALVAQIVPEARVCVAHGRMPERALERTMLDFVGGRYDVLCSTAIVENGLDIARCNTIIIDRADLLGLGELYQLRGRVGRAKERAYCYLVLPPGAALGSEAQARIEAIARHSELGQGLAIASLDLDLRGAGDLLGAEQSGTVAAVGFEMYCEMLEQAVQELRGLPAAPEIEPELSFDAEALLPEDYVADVGLRLSLYKRLASAGGADEVRALGAEIEDRFGPAPAEARRLLHLMHLKTELRRLKVLACEATRQGVRLTLRDDTPLEAQRLARLCGERGSPYRLAPDMILARRTLPGERFPSGIEATERMLAEIQRCLGASTASELNVLPSSAGLALHSRPR